MFSLICVWINGRVNNREAGDLKRQGGHYDVIIMLLSLEDFLSSLYSPIGVLAENNVTFDAIE